MSCVMVHFPCIVRQTSVNYGPCLGLGCITLGLRNQVYVLGRLNEQISVL